MRTEHVERKNLSVPGMEVAREDFRGEDKKIEGRVYDCQIRDLEGKISSSKLTV